MRFNTPTTIVIARKEFLGASCDSNICSTCNDGMKLMLIVEDLVMLAKLVMIELKMAMKPVLIADRVVLIARI